MLNTVQNAQESDHRQGRDKHILLIIVLPQSLTLGLLFKISCLFTCIIIKKYQFIWNLAYAPCSSPDRIRQPADR